MDYEVPLLGAHQTSGDEEHEQQQQQELQVRQQSLSLSDPDSSRAAAAYSRPGDSAAAFGGDWRGKLAAVGQRVRASSAELGKRFTEAATAVGSRLEEQVSVVGERVKDLVLPTTQADILVDRATAEELLAPHWSTVLQISHLLQNGHVPGGDVARALRRRLATRDADAPAVLIQKLRERLLPLDKEGNPRLLPFESVIGDAYRGARRIHITRPPSELPNQHREVVAMAADFLVGPNVQGRRTTPHVRFVMPRGGGGGTAGAAGGAVGAAVGGGNDHTQRQQHRHHHHNHHQRQREEAEEAVWMGAGEAVADPKTTFAMARNAADLLTTMLTSAPAIEALKCRAAKRSLQRLLQQEAVMADDSLLFDGLSAVDDVDAALARLAAMRDEVKGAQGKKKHRWGRGRGNGKGGSGGEGAGESGEGTGGVAEWVMGCGGEGFGGGSGEGGNVGTIEEGEDEGYESGEEEEEEEEGEALERGRRRSLEGDGEGRASGGEGEDRGTQEEERNTVKAGEVKDGGSSIGGEGGVVEGGGGVGAETGAEAVEGRVADEMRAGGVAVGDSAASPGGGGVAEKTEGGGEVFF
ncbi:unnamed protein product [Closterium sp. NIES-54]